MLERSAGKLARSVLRGLGEGEPTWLPGGVKTLSTSQLATILIPEWDRRIISPMRVIAKRTLRQFWESAPQYADAKGPLDAWYAEARKAQWHTPQDIKAQFRHASILKNQRVVFNIGGNKYRLIVAVDYRRQVLFIRFIGTHTQYDTIDAEVV